MFMPTQLGDDGDKEGDCDDRNNYDENQTCVIPWWWGCRDILEPNVIAT